MSQKHQNDRKNKVEKETEVLTAEQDADANPKPGQSEPAAPDGGRTEAQEHVSGEQGKESGGEAVEGEQQAEAPQMIESVVYEKLQEQYEQLNNKYLRLAAEFDNYKKRMEREFTRRVQFANEEFLREILPILDDLERAMEASEEEQSAETLKSGIELVYENFKNVLKRRGVETIDAVGKPFDPELHDAVMVQESEDHDSEMVIREFERGYKLGDKVLRHAKVVVSR